MPNALRVFPSLTALFVCFVLFSVEGLFEKDCRAAIAHPKQELGLCSTSLGVHLSAAEDVGQSSSLLIRILQSLPLLQLDWRRRWWKSSGNFFFSTFVLLSFSLLIYWFRIFCSFFPLLFSVFLLCDVLSYDMIDDFLVCANSRTLRFVKKTNKKSKTKIQKKVSEKGVNDVDKPGYKGRSISAFDHLQWDWTNWVDTTVFTHRKARGVLVLRQFIVGSFIWERQTTTMSHPLLSGR